MSDGKLQAEGKTVRERKWRDRGKLPAEQGGGDG